MMRAASTVAMALLAGCSAARDFWRPEGDGGWTSVQRRAAVGALAPEAGVEDPLMPRPTPVEPLRYDLRRALDQATRANRAIAEADQQVAIARARALEARGLLLPSTTSNGNYTWYSDVRTTHPELPAGVLPPGSPPISIPLSDSSAGTINALFSQPIDLSGELRETLKAAQAGYRGEAARRWATELEQDLLVMRTYFNRLAAERLREVTQQTIAAYQKQFDDADQRFRAGRVTKNEVLEVQVVLRNAQQRLDQDDLAIERSRWTFNRVIGVDVNAPTEVVDQRDRPVLPDDAEMLRKAQDNNPVLTALFERQRQLEAELSALERSRLPRFNAGGQLAYSSSTLFTPQAIGAGFVGFNWDLGTDTRREERITAAKLAVDDNHLQLESELRELEESLRATRRAAAERLTALDTASVAVGQAEENLRIRQQQFEAGRAETRDVLEAQRLLAEQRAVLATALYEAQTRRAELQQLMGEPFDTLLADQR
jgi:outer membrane protein TolC